MPPRTRGQAPGESRAGSPLARGRTDEVGCRLVKAYARSRRLALRSPMSRATSIRRTGRVLRCWPFRFESRMIGYELVQQINLDCCNGQSDCLCVSRIFFCSQTIIEKRHEFREFVRTLKSGPRNMTCNIDVHCECSLSIQAEIVLKLAINIHYLLVVPLITHSRPCEPSTG